ncbi:hypothetical protein JTF08_13750 [Micrococcaceae bacterium RIT802]|nr:hypothetical protein [Micrococcaceae bacterium RIT 802]
MKFRLGNTEFGGESGHIIVSGFDPGPPELITNDNQRPQRDGIMVGRDYLGEQNWAFDLVTNRNNLTEAIQTAAELAAAWRSPSVRRAPNVVVPLSYEMDGRWRRVYGRPGRFAGIKGDVLAVQGGGRITADFRVTDPLFYDEAEASVVLTIVPATTGGLVAPLVAPLTSARSSAPRAGFVENVGDAETPLKVVFHGPVADPWVRAAAGWEIGLTGSLAYDVSVTVDPLAGTVTRSDGAPVAGMLTRATRLSRSLLPVGQSELTFGGSDITGTATATLSWRNAYQSI